MNLIKKFLSLDANHKSLWIMIVVAFIGFLAFTPLFFFASDAGVSHYSLPLGWLLGSLIEIVCFLSIVRMSDSLLSSASSDSSAAGRSIFFSAGRFLLWVAGLVVSAICTFKSEWFGGFQGFNFFTVAAAYLPMLFIVLIMQLLSLKKNRHEEGAKK